MFKKIVYTLVFLFVIGFGFYLGRESTPPKGNEDLALDIIYPDNASVNYETKEKVIKVSSEKKNDLKLKIKEKKGIDLLRLVALQKHIGYSKEAVSETEEIKESIENNPEDYFVEIDRLIFDTGNIELRDQQVLLQIAMSVPVSERAKLSLLEKVSRIKLTTDKRGKPTDECYLKMSAIREMINLYPFDDVETIITENIQGEDPKLVRTFVVSAVLAKYPDKKYLFDNIEEEN